MKRRRLLFSAIAVFSIGALVAYGWPRAPATPRELFETRCGTCHALPGLAGYKRHELAPLVHFMRAHNGADRVITDREAGVIIRFLEDNLRTPPPSDERPN